MASAEEWTLEREKQLIKLFKHCEALWKKSHPLYHSVRVRKAAMLAISVHLGMTQKTVLLKLNSIKNHLNTFCRKERTVVKSKKHLYKSGYQLFDECDFFLKEIQERAAKREWAKKLLAGQTPPVVAEVPSSELRVPIIEEKLFFIIMQSYYSIGARKEYEFDWNAIVNKLGFNSKKSQCVEPGKARETWSNMSLGLIKACEHLCPGSDGCDVDVWKALQFLMTVPTEIIPQEYAWINKLVVLYSSTPPRFCEYDNELLFQLIEKKPILKQMFQKCKQSVRILAWEEVTNEYDAIKHTNSDKFKLKKHWLTLLRTIEQRMIIFMKSVNETPKDGNICAPTDLEKRIIQRNPKLLILSKSRECSVVQSHVDIHPTGKESNERASDPPETEENTAEAGSELDPTGKKAVKEAGVVYNSSRKLEIIDVHTGDEEHAMVYEVNEDFIEDLEVKHVLCGLKNSKGQLSDEDVSFLLVKWLSADARERKIESIPTSSFSAFATKDNTWNAIARKFQPYCPQNPKELFKKWKKIFFHTLSNVELNTRNHSDMTDLDWMILQSFPSMFINNARNIKSTEDDASATITSAPALPSETIVPESSEQSPVLSSATTTLTNEDNTRLPGYREGTEITYVKQEPIDNNSEIPNNEPLSLDQSLPELKRHQKPIILSDKTDVLKMNQQLQTAAISPNCSKSKENRIRKGEKLTLMKKCQKGQVMDVQLTWGQKKKESTEKRYLSYRPNPKFFRETAGWMTKPKLPDIGVPVARIIEPVVKFIDKTEAYQDFLNTLEKFSQCEPKPACTVYKPPEIRERDQNLILNQTPITEDTDNVPETKTPETINLFSDSNSDSDGSILNFTVLREIAARETETKTMRSMAQRFNGARCRIIPNIVSKRRVNARKSRPYNRRIPKSTAEQNSLPKRDDTDPVQGPITSKGIFTNLKRGGRPPKAGNLPPNFITGKNKSPSDVGEIASPNKSLSVESISSSEEDSDSDWSSRYKTAVKQKIYPKNLRSEKVNILNVTQAKTREEQTSSEVMNLVITAPILDKPITMEVNIAPSTNDFGGRALLSNPDLLIGKNAKPGELSSIPITYKDLQPIIKCRKKTELIPPIITYEDLQPKIKCRKKTDLIPPIITYEDLQPIIKCHKKTDLIPPIDPFEDTTSMDSQKEMATLDSQTKIKSVDLTDSPKTTATSNVNSQQETAPCVISDEDQNIPTDSSKIDLRSYYSMMADSLDFSNLDDGDFGFGDLEDREVLESENSTVVPVSINQAEHTLDADEDSSYILPEPADSIQAVKKLHETIINVSDSEDEIPLAMFTKRSKK